jgi:hypothetical protein
MSRAVAAARAAAARRHDAEEKGGGYMLQDQKFQRLTSNWFRWNIDG